MNNLKNILFIPFIFYFAPDLNSQTDSTKSYLLSDVVITATKTEMPQIELASSISVIDSEEIASSKKNSVFDLLKNQYGLSFTQQGGTGMLANIFLRGSEAGHSLILIDGIEVNMTNDPDNSFDFSSLSSDNISRIEVLRGPQSVLYGSNAVGGVINIITQNGYGKPKFSLITEGGSYNTYRASAGINGSYNLLSYSLTAGRVKTDGFSDVSERFGGAEKDGHSSYHLSSKINARILSNFSLNFILNFSDSKTDYDQITTIFVDDPTFIFNLQESSYKAEADLDLFNGFWKQKGIVSFSRNLRKYNSDSIPAIPFPSRSLYDGNKLKFEWLNNLNFSKIFSALVGIETEKEGSATEYYSGTYASIMPSSSTGTTGIYMQNQFTFGNNFFTSLSGRADRHDLFGWAYTYRIAPAYVFWETGTKLKATFGTGFRAPSLFNLFDPTFGNRELNPEKSIGWDAGIEQYLFNRSVNLGVTYFSNFFKDLFGYDLNYKTINTDKAGTNGIEVYLSSEPLDNIKLNANYTFMHTEDKSDNSADKGKELLRRPKLKAGLSVDWGFFKDADANVEIIYVGRREDINLNFERTTLKEYALLNLALSYKFFGLAEIFGRVENLFNTEYEDVFGYGTAGLSGYAGIKLTF